MISLTWEFGTSGLFRPFRLSIAKRILSTRPDFKSSLSFHSALFAKRKSLNSELHLLKKSQKKLMNFTTFSISKYVRWLTTFLYLLPMMSEFTITLLGRLCMCLQSWMRLLFKLTLLRLSLVTRAENTFWETLAGMWESLTAKQVSSCKRFSLQRTSSTKIRPS